MGAIGIAAELKNPLAIYTQAKGKGEMTLRAEQALWKIPSFANPGVAGTLRKFSRHRGFGLGGGVCQTSRAILREMAGFDFAQQRRLVG